jgi:hypothetical protein
MHNLQADSFPPSFIVKDSWPLRLNELDMYLAAPGRFGVPDVICCFPVQGPNGKDYSTESFIPLGSTFWNVFRHEGLSTENENKPEARFHSRSVFATEGRNLLDASSPKELLQGILHGMIGVLGHRVGAQTTNVLLEAT